MNHPWSDRMMLHFLTVVIVVGIIAGFVFVLQQEQSTIRQNYIIDQTNALVNDSREESLKELHLLGTIVHEIQVKDAEELIEQNFLNAFIGYQNKIMIKELASQLGIDNIKNTPMLNNTFNDYPHYLANETHITIIFGENDTKVIDVPTELRNLINPFNSEVSKNVTKLHQR